MILVDPFVATKSFSQNAPNKFCDEQKSDFLKNITRSTSLNEVVFLLRVKLIPSFYRVAALEHNLILFASKALSESYAKNSLTARYEIK